MDTSLQESVRNVELWSSCGEIRKLFTKVNRGRTEHIINFIDENIKQQNLARMSSI